MTLKERLAELDKLEYYLRGKEIAYERVDRCEISDEEINRLIEAGYCDIKAKESIKERFSRHQIAIPAVGADNWEWDAICHNGSYGYEEGLLEVMGDPVVRKEDGDSVKGFLTADDVIQRLEEYYAKTK